MLAAGSAFLQKPFSLDTLLRRIRDILDVGTSAS
jgi:DNA-binding response OmpR family regulator